MAHVPVLEPKFLHSAEIESEVQTQKMRSAIIRRGQTLFRGQILQYYAMANAIILNLMTPSQPVDTRDTLRPIETRVQQHI